MAELSAGLAGPETFLPVKPSTAKSPNGGDTSGRDSLHKRFSGRISINPRFTRRIVSYQGNRKAPGLRWMKYKEGFSRTLVSYFLDKYEPKHVLDPFAGIGTTALTASGRGIQATGIELMPVGTLVGSGIAAASNGLPRDSIRNASKSLLDYVSSKRPAPPKHAFPHVKITQSAFSSKTESALAKARCFISGMGEGAEKTLVNLACMSILEDVSYTRKDGQFLRWDNRSGRTLRSRMHKGPIPTVLDALKLRFLNMESDLPKIRELYGGEDPEFVSGSSLELLKTLPEAQFDMVITSPPYANRYDYTRTYALELAWLGFDQKGFSQLRQRMLSATVENRTKIDAFRRLYQDCPGILHRAISNYESQAALHEVLEILREHIRELGNRHVIRLLEGYFLEMSLIVAELGRVVKPGGSVIMVNDNVQYHGEEVPVDFILSAMAESSGFDCTNIWMLARGKGNSSQQMGRFGRREIRKCVYRWVRSNAPVWMMQGKSPDFCLG